jgi:hypothetical protein
MTGIKTRSSRRAFFVSGGAALGAGVATAVGASALTSGKPTSAEDELGRLQDREAIRQLQLAFIGLIEKQAYESAAELFDEHARLDLSGVTATGKPAIRKLFADQYREQEAAVFHNAYRQSPSQQGDEVMLSEQRLQATATFHVEVELCTPLQADCTVAQMARQQGHVADRRWEAGRFEASYVKAQGEWPLGQWKIASLSYRSSQRIIPRRLGA